jgi:hypothetical protein
MTLPSKARLFALKLGKSLSDEPITKTSQTPKMTDIMNSLKNWRSNKNNVSYEDLINAWIKEHASTPKAKCQAKFYLGYSFAFQFLDNLKRLKISKEAAREQLMSLVNGKVNTGKTTFLAMTGESTTVGNDAMTVKDKTDGMMQEVIDEGVEKKEGDMGFDGLEEMEEVTGWDVEPEGMEKMDSIGQEELDGPGDEMNVIKTIQNISKTEEEVKTTQIKTTSVLTTMKRIVEGKRKA